MQLLYLLILISGIASSESKLNDTLDSFLAINQSENPKSCPIVLPSQSILASKYCQDPVEAICGISKESEGLAGSKVDHLKEKIAKNLKKATKKTKSEYDQLPLRDKIKHWKEAWSSALDTYQSEVGKWRKETLSEKNITTVKSRMIEQLKRSRMFSREDLKVVGGVISSIKIVTADNIQTNIERVTYDEVCRDFGENAAYIAGVNLMIVCDSLFFSNRANSSQLDREAALYFVLWHEIGHAIEGAMALLDKAGSDHPYENFKQCLMKRHPLQTRISQKVAHELYQIKEKGDCVLPECAEVAIVKFEIALIKPEEVLADYWATAVLKYHLKEKFDSGALTRNQVLRYLQGSMDIFCDNLLQFATTHPEAEDRVRLLGNDPIMREMMGCGPPNERQLQPRCELSLDAEN